MFATFARMDVGGCSKCGCRFSAAHIRPKRLQQLHGWRAALFQNGMSFEICDFMTGNSDCSSYTDAGQPLFEMRFSLDVSSVVMTGSA